MFVVRFNHEEGKKREKKAHISQAFINVCLLVGVVRTALLTFLRLRGIGLM